MSYTGYSQSFFLADTQENPRNNFHNSVLIGMQRNQDIEFLFQENMVTEIIK